MKDLLERALWTAAQAFLGMLSSDALTGRYDPKLVVVIALGISVAKNYVRARLNAYPDDGTTPADDDAVS